MRPKSMPDKKDSDIPLAVNKAKQGLFYDLVGLKRLWPYISSNKKLVLISCLLIPVISVFQAFIPMTLRHAIDDGVTQSDFKALAFWATSFGVLVVLEYFTRAGQSISTSYAVFRMIRDLRQNLVRHVMDLKANFHDRTLSGTLTTRATSDFDNLSESLNMGVLTLIVDFAVLLGLLIGMFSLSFHLATVAIIILPVVFIIVQYFSAALKAAMIKARVRIAALNGYTQECLYGHTTIKVLTGESAASKKYQKLNNDFRDAQMGSVVLDAMMFSVLDGIASVTLGLALWYVIAPDSTSILSAGILVAFVQYIQQIFDPLKNLGNKMAMLQGAFTSLDRIFGLLKEQEFVEGKQKPKEITGRISFQNVRFRYGQDKPEVLKGLSFDLLPGQSLAIVGATGSGKSTMIKLISRLYDRYEGFISIDGQDLNNINPNFLRRQIAIVPQDIALFEGSLFFNIGLDLPGVTKDDMIQAAKLVGADEFIVKLDGQYEHKITERGTSLSYGQRQLIAFARAMCRKPGLVILDEATSSIDPASEQMIQKATEAVLSQKTVIVIAHRLETIRKCDQILVIENGTKVESGTHEELIKSRGAYFDLFHGHKRSLSSLGT